MRVLRIGTRGSRLAIAQARIAADGLQVHGVQTELVPLHTRGDAISARAPRGSWAAPDGQFTRELEAALLDRRVDAVVHSYKDLPIAPVPGLVIGAVLERADARDCLLTADGGGLDDLPFGGRIGTSSPRRAAQLAVARADLIAVPMRGNVETRIARLRAGEYDAIVLAAAGLDRLGIPVPADARLPFDLILPAPAQGALAVQARSDDATVLTVLDRLDHQPTHVASDTERALLSRIGGGCLAALGAHASVDGSTIRLRAALEDGAGTFRRAEATGQLTDREALVDAVASALLEMAAAS